MIIMFFRKNFFKIGFYLAFLGGLFCSFKGVGLLYSTSMLDLIIHKKNLASILMYLTLGILVGLLLSYMEDHNKRKELTKGKF